MFHRVLLHDGKRGEDCVNERAANETRAGFRLPLLLCRSHATAASTGYSPLAQLLGHYTSIVCASYVTFYAFREEKIK